MKHSKTSRGFELVEFRDHYGKPCSLQQSSAALTNIPGAGAVWLGIDGVEAKVLHHQASSVGVVTEAREGWVDFPIPECVSVTTRIHLNRRQVKALVVRLNRWIKTGKFGK